MTVQSDPDRRALLLCVEKYDPKTLSKSPRIRGKAFAELARTRDDARRMHEEVEKLGFVAEHLSDMCAQGISRKVAKFVQQAVKHQAKIASEPPHVRLDRNQVVLLFFSGHGVYVNGKQYAVGDDAGIVNLYKEFLVELNKQLHNAVIILCMDACSEAANATVAAASEAATAEIAAESTSAPFSMQEGGAGTPSQSIPLSIDELTVTEFSNEMGANTGTIDGAPISSHELGSVAARARRKRIIKVAPENDNILVCAYACHGGEHAYEGKFYGRFTEKLVEHIQMREDIEVMLARVRKDLEEYEQPPRIEVAPSRPQRSERFSLARSRAPPVVEIKSKPSKPKTKFLTTLHSLHSQASQASMGAPASSNMHGSGIIPELLEAKCATHDPHALSTDMHHPPHFHISGPLKQEAGAVEGQCASNDSVVVEPRQATVVLHEDRSQEARFRYTFEEQTDSATITHITEVTVTFAADGSPCYSDKRRLRRRPTKQHGSHFCVGGGSDRKQHEALTLNIPSSVLGPPQASIEISTLGPDACSSTIGHSRTLGAQMETSKADNLCGENSMPPDQSLSIMQSAHTASIRDSSSAQVQANEEPAAPAELPALLSTPSAVAGHLAEEPMHAETPRQVPRGHSNPQQRALSHWLAEACAKAEPLVGRFKLIKGSLSVGAQGCVRLAEDIRGTDGSIATNTSSAAAAACPVAAIPDMIGSPCAADQPSHQVEVAAAPAVRKAALKFFYRLSDFESEASIFHSAVVQAAKVVPATLAIRRFGTEEAPSGRRRSSDDRMHATPFIAMQAGTTLSEVVADSSRSISPMHIVLDIARLLATFHRLGLAHRDVKPANILDVSEDPHTHDWRLIDLATHATLGSQVPPAFTLRYAAPEAANSSSMRLATSGAPVDSPCGSTHGEPADANTPYTPQQHLTMLETTDALDMWSFGVIALELLTTDREVLTLHASTNQVVRAAARGEAAYPWETRVGVPKPDLGLVPDAAYHALEEMLHACLSRDPRKRPSAQEVATTLDRCMHLKDMPVDSVSVSSATFSLYINGGDARGRSQLASRESGLALGEPTQRAIKWADVAAANAAACHIPPEDARGSLAMLTEALSSNLQGLPVSLDRAVIGSTTSAAYSSPGGFTRFHQQDLWPLQAEVNWTNVRYGLFGLHPIPQGAQVWSIAGAGTRLSCGTLHLGPMGCLVLDSSCVDVQLSSMHVSGGVLVCQGEGCFVSFADMKFINTTVVVTGGAGARFTQCAFEQPRTRRSAGIAVMAYGHGSKVVMENCTLQGGLQGAAVHEGACMEATALTISETGVTAVEAMGEQSHLLIKSCTINYLLEGAPKGFQNLRERTDIRGVFVHHCASAQLHDVTIVDAEWGIFTCDDAECDMHGCHVHDTENACVSFRSGGSGSAVDSEFSRSKRAHGLEVSCRSAETRACVHLRNCEMTQNRQAGAAVFGAGKLTLSECQTSGNKSAGYWAHDDACMEASDCSSEGDKTGFGASNKALMNAEGCTVSNCQTGSFMIKSGSCANLSDCTSTDCETAGIMISGAETKASLSGCRVERCVGNGIHVHAAATCMLDLCTVKTTLNGVVVEQSTLAATRLTVARTHKSGITLQGGEVDMHECLVEQCGGAGLRATKMLARVSMNRCKVHQTSQACVNLQDGSTGLLTDSQFGDSRESHGIVVLGVCTAATLHSCRMYGNAKCGVKVADCAVLKADHCVSLNNVGSAFEAVRKAEVTLEQIVSTSDGAGCTIRGSTADIRGTRCNECDTVGFEFSCAATVRLERGFAVSAGTSGMKVSGSATTVEILGCEVRDNGEYGVVVCTRACVIASRIVSQGHDGGAGFRCKDRGTVLNLDNCKSFDAVPYQCDMLGVLRCVDCCPAKPKGANLVKVVKDGLGLRRVRGGGVQTIQ